MRLKFILSAVILAFFLGLLPARFVLAQNQPASSLQAIIEDLQRQIQTLQKQLLELKGELGVEGSKIEEAPAPSTLPEFSRPLSLGSRGDNVRDLQAFLAKDKEIYPEGLITGYFGPLTQRAIQRFQEKHNIVTAGTPSASGYGQFGPKTIAKVKELLEEGAGASGKVPPGLLTAPGIQKKIEPPAAATTSTSTPSVATTTPPTATTTPPVATTTAPVVTPPPLPPPGALPPPPPPPPPSSDTTSPSVSIVNPANNATVYVNGTITVLADVSDNVGVIGVQFKFDGENLGSEIYTSTSTLSSAVIYWNTAGAVVGTHTISAVARDAAGNTASASNQITVASNSPPPPPPPPPPGSETRITTNSSIQAEPRINGNIIVWTDYRNGGSNRDVYMYNLANGTETQITTNPYDQFFPDVYGNRIVYTGRSTSNSPPHIYLYDLSTNSETLLTNNSYMQTLPSIYGDKVVYSDNRSGNWGIYLYNLSTNTEQIIANVGDWPQVSDNYIVWMNGTGGIYKTYYYNLNSGSAQAIASSNSDQMYPYVYGTKIVYAGRAVAGGPDWDIYLYDILTGTETRLTSASGVQTTKPSIAGNYVSWVDYRGGYTGDIYLYNLSNNTEAKLTAGAGSQYNVADMNNNMIVWSESRNDNYDIYLYTISSGSSQAPSSKLSALAQILQVLISLFEDILRLAR